MRAGERLDYAALVHFEVPTMGSFLESSTDLLRTGGHSVALTCVCALAAARRYMIR